MIFFFFSFAPFADGAIEVKHALAITYTDTPHYQLKQICCLNNKRELINCKEQWNAKVFKLNKSIHL